MENDNNYMNREPVAFNAYNNKRISDARAYVANAIMEKVTECDVPMGSNLAEKWAQVSNSIESANNLSMPSTFGVTKKYKPLEQDFDGEVISEPKRTLPTLLRQDFD